MISPDVMDLEFGKYSIIKHLKGPSLRGAKALLKIRVDSLVPVVLESLSKNFSGDFKW